MTRRNPFLFLLFALTLGVCALGQQAHLEWEALSGAVSYEIEILRPGQATLQQRIDGGKSEWSGNLPYGIYSFRLRAIDWAGQKSEWSTAQQFIASPPAPEPLGPASQARFAIESLTAGVLLQWKASPQTRLYRLQIQRDGYPLRTLDTDKLQYVLVDKVPGRYEFRVRPLIEPPGGATAVEGDVSDWRVFRILPPEETLAPPRERFSTGVDVSPISTFYRLNLVDKATTARASLVSQFNFGADVTATYRLRNRHALQYSGRILATELQGVPGRTIYGLKQLLLNHSLGYAFRLGFLPEVSWKIYWGLGSVAFVQINADASLTHAPLTLHRVGVFTDAPLVHFWGMQLGIRGKFAVFIPGPQAQSGVEGEASLFIGNDPVPGLGWSVFLGYHGLKMETSTLEVLQDEPLFGLGLHYRF